MLSEPEFEAGRQFLRNYCQDEIQQLGQKWPSEKQSLVVDRLDLCRGDIYEDENAGYYLTNHADDVIKDLREIAKAYDYPLDMDIEPDVRISGSEIERTVEQLRKDDVGCYVQVHGQVNQLTQVLPKAVNAVFNCRNCSSRSTVMQSGGMLEEPTGGCDACKTSNPSWVLNDQATTYQDHQVIELASLPEDTGGQTADTIKVEVTNDIAGVVSAGDRVKISGILKTEKDDLLTEKHPDARREMWLDGRAIQNEQESFAEIEPSRIDEIQELSEADDIYQKLTDSFAPHIVTNDEGDMQKLAIILSLFGGVQKQLDTGSQIRGNVNVLLIGDGGTAKSQYLKTAEKIAPKSVLASGKGATAAGLTATAEQSNLTGEWTLKAGALVMANNGVACIDEFDKMDGSARKSIHEALENQEVPVTKAGINTVLPAKTAVIAAANPDGGEFNRFDDLVEQIDMEQPLVSRFDLIFGLVDRQDKERDAAIANAQHDIADDSDDVEPDVEYDLLREYIAYARQIEPSYASQSVKDRLVNFYVDLREEAEDGDEPGPRLNDSLRRLSQASARVRLSDEIEMEDAERAIEFVNYTIGQVGLDEEGNVSGSALNGGERGGGESRPPQNQKERREAVWDIIDSLEGDEPATEESVISEAGERGIESSKVEHCIQKLSQRGEIYEPQTRCYRTS